MNYPGGKNGSGVYQKIINQMPPHDVYIEPFLGGGAVMRLKKPASSSIAIDADGDVLKMWKKIKIPGITIKHGDAISLLPNLVESLRDKKVLVYADPPYLGDTRSSTRPIYKHEMTSDEDHLLLLSLLKGLKCDVMISGYWSNLYERELKDWRTVSFQSMTRGGFAATEWLWMNYDEPFELHDYRYLGNDFRERERIKRKRVRWRERLKKMPALERFALMEAIASVKKSDAS